MLKESPQSAIVIYPAVLSVADASLRSPEGRLAEAVGLTEAIGLAVVFSEVIKVNNIKPSSYLGQGNVERLTAHELEHELVAGFFDDFFVGADLGDITIVV